MKPLLPSRVTRHASLVTLLAAFASAAISAHANAASFYRVERDAVGAWRLIDPAGEWGLFDNACAKPEGNTTRIALDSGLPCLRGVGKRFDTQAERAWATALYARSVLSSPWVIGYDYFMWVDMPAKGISFRFPEDSNYGLVREDGTAYAEITQAFAAIQWRDGLDFDAWRKQLQTRGPLEPPSWTPRITVDYLDGEYIPVTNRAAKPPTFERDGNSWCVENAAGLRLLSPSRREARNTETRRGENPDGYAQKTHRVAAAWRSPCRICLKTDWSRA